jgi:hypothetical protein
MKRIEFIAAILTLLAGGTYSSRAQNATHNRYIKASNTGAKGSKGSVLGQS